MSYIKKNYLAKNLIIGIIDPEDIKDIEYTYQSIQNQLQEKISNELNLKGEMKDLIKVQLKTTWDIIHPFKKFIYKIKSKFGGDEKKLLKMEIRADIILIDFNVKHFLRNYERKIEQSFEKISKIDHIKWDDKIE